MNLTTATPVEIDTVLATLYRAETGLIHQVETKAYYVADKAGILLPGQKARYRDEREAGTLTEAVAILSAVIADGDLDYRWSEASYAKDTLDRLTEAQDALAANLAEQAPLHEEFDRRGGWTRSFMVLNTNGHAHKDTHCSTCFPTTRYGWLTEVSGKTEAEVVEALGSDACSTCYPTAPVVKRPRTTFAPEEREAQAERAAKAAAKVEREAKKAAKALVLDLRPFGVDGYAGRIETLAAAKMYLTDSFGWRDGHPSYPAAAVAHVAEAVAAKVGTTPEEEMAAARKRYAKRR